VETRCVECEETITNPICPACLKEAIQQWLLGDGDEERSEELSELTRRIFANTGDTWCVRCGSSMALCAYCYTREALRLVPPERIPDFIEYFTFDLGHQGYEKREVATMDRLVQVSFNDWMRAVEEKRQKAKLEDDAEAIWQRREDG
jgi:hypothetical protein